MHEIKSRYPVYLVHELSSAEDAERSQAFKMADNAFESKRLELEQANHDISFQMYTNHDQLVLVLEYEHIPPGDGEHGEIALYFDPGHTRRKRHNAFVFRLKPDGSLLYEKFLYEIEQLPVPEGVRYTLDCEEGLCRAEIVIPLAYLLVLSDEQRIVGFNAVRTLKRDGRVQHVAWSGAPGDRPNTGHGTGDLLLTRGFNQEEIDRLLEKITAESETYYTRWVKWNIPKEMVKWVQEKQSGFTIRMNKEDVQKARDNAVNTEWGRKMKREICRIADYWAAKSDDELFDLVPVGNPRALSVGQFFGDPFTGGKRTAYQVCLERPYQYYNPVSKTWWYNGKIIKNPTTGEDVMVNDDGRGFMAPEGFPNPGVRYMYTASYRLFILSMLMGNPYCDVLEDRSVCPETTGRENAGAIPNLAYAYLLTGDMTYARKALVLIGRIAELVPYMNGNYGSGYYDTVQISEPTTTESHWLSNFFEAADLLYDIIAELGPQLEVFFAGKPDAENKVRAIPFCVKKALHGMIPYILYSCEIEKTRDADWSLRWIYLELILASFMQNGRLMQRIIYEGKYSLQSKFRNNFFRDGRYIYDSISYLLMICDQISLMANNTYRFRDEELFPDGINLFEDQQFGISQVIRLYTHLKTGNLIAMFGDNAFCDNREPISEDRKKGKFSYSPAFEIIYRRMSSAREVIGPALAQYEADELENYRVQSVQSTNVKHALLILATAAEWDEYQRHNEGARCIQPSFLLQDSETSIFRSGTDPHNCKHVMLYGAPSSGHRHGDKLGLWIGAYGYHLLAGAGGYPFTWISPKWQTWEVHSAACTVVVVDGQDQKLSYSRQKCHYEGDLLQGAGLENTTAYPGTHLERWSWVIQAPNREDAYIVDINHVSGGRVFDYNTLGLDISFDSVRFHGIEQQDWLPLHGTLAGPNVPLYSEPGYGWMKAVRKAETSTPVSWTFQYGGAGLKVHTVPDGERREIVCSLGERGGQEMGKSRWEPFVMWRDAVEEEDEPHAATFATVLEPFEQQHAFIRAVRPMEFINRATQSSYKPVGIEIHYQTGGYRDFVISNYGPNDGVCFRNSNGEKISTDAMMLLLRYKDYNLARVEAVGYTYISAGDYRRTRPSRSYTGVMAAVDIEARRLQVKLDPGCGEFPLGANSHVALIDSPDYEKPSAYYICQPKQEGDLLTFQTDMSLIKLEVGWKSPHKKLGLGRKQMVEHEGKTVYVDVKAGDSFTILNSLQEVLLS
jgi:hypothetical protein